MADQVISSDFTALIRWGREERHLEYKRSMSWDDPATKAKLTKSALAMANLRDGGNIVLGMRRQSDDSYLAEGMGDEDLRTFVGDKIGAHLAEFADPFIETTLIPHVVDGKTFLIIRVNEFAELPVICKRDGANLRRGATYIRGKRIPETVEVPSHVEMREILDLALEKRSRAFTRQAGRMGYVQASRQDEFAIQLKSPPETEILKRIWAMGRWRVSIRPTVFEKARFQNLEACRHFMILNAVNIAGWQYPPVSESLIQTGEDWISCEADFLPHLERWVLFRSSQFVHNFAFPEEFLGTEAWPVHPQFFVPKKDKRYLNIFETLKTVTCAYEFAARMTCQELLAPSATLTIELHGVDGRELSYMNRVPKLEGTHWCRRASINLEYIHSLEDLKTRGRELALDAAVEIFKEFNWSDPPRALLAEYQTRIMTQ